MLEIREIIEPRDAYLAAARANEAGLREIERARLACEESVRRLGVLIETDPEFHSAIIRAANKAILIDLHHSFRKRHAITVRTMRG